ncbi:hypothetical protein ACINWC743_1719 [Acinetobacter sp. WC-743]|nr:hypothetical protein ACINWC743_1719 [Acinetobacter sp. WC-743]
MNFDFFHLLLHHNFNRQNQSNTLLIKLHAERIVIAEGFTS